MFKLDYTLQTPEERNDYVSKLIEENPDISDHYLEVLANYLILSMDKQERKNRKILTDNRLATVNKRETSFEGLVSQFENGEDGIYNIITEDKNIIFQPKVTITKKDLDEIPQLRQLRKAIEYWETRMRTAVGREAYIIKQTLIELRKDQYIVRNAYRKPIVCSQLAHSRHFIPLDEIVTLDAEGWPLAQGVSLLDPKVCSAILCNYSRLKEDSYDNFESDTWYLLTDFDNISSKALKPYPMYERIVECKIDGMQNTDIQLLLQQEFGIRHSAEYISSLWRKKIPALIASCAEDQWLNTYYLNDARGRYKRCSCCGQIKLAHNKYFSKNKTSKDGFYSICKVCRNSRGKKK